MKKLLLFSGLVILFNAKSFSQVEVNLTEENTNPDFVEGHIPIITVGLSSISTFSADFGAKLKLNRFYFDMTGQITYLNYYNESEEVDGNSIYKYKMPKEFSATFGVMVIQKEIDTKISFHLKSAGRTDYYTKVPTKKTGFMMVDLGFRNGFKVVGGENRELVIENATPEGFFAPEAGNIRTMMDYQILEVGISGGFTGAYKADIKDFGIRKTSMFNRVYLHVLLLMNSSVDDIYYKRTTGNNQEVTVYNQYHLNNTPRAKMGFSVGININNIDRFGWNTGVEGAYVPGLNGSIGSNFVLSLKSSLSLAKLFH
ncbi:MAG: hypothetical protein K0S44_2397 [Bacteroidetes bacterium]|jgi:hypothetical protein|nr:hypothetical protein [Bacteroidota bacterium]